MFGLWIKGAILHDTVEDTNTTLDEVESRFGKEVRHIVSEVTDDKRLPKLERKRLQIAHAKTCRLVEGMVDKQCVLLVYAMGRVPFLWYNKEKTERDPNPWWG